MFSNRLMTMIKRKPLTTKKSNLQSTSILNKRFYHEHSQSPQSFHEALESIYNKLDQAVSNGISIAKCKNKKIVVVAGEEHNTDECMLTEIMLLSIANKNMMNRLYVEQTSPQMLEYLMQRKEMIQNNSSLYFDFKRYADDGLHPNHINMLDAYLVANYSNIKIMGIDIPRKDELYNLGFSNFFVSPKGMNYRDLHMAIKLATTREDGIAFVGTAHLQGILENKILNTQYHVVGVNAYPAVNFVDFTTFFKKKMVYAIENEKIVQIPSIPSMMRFFTSEVVKETLEFCKEKEKTLTCNSRC